MHRGVFHKVALFPIYIFIPLEFLGGEMLKDPVGDTVSPVIREDIVIKRPHMIQTWETIFHYLKHFFSADTDLMLLVNIYVLQYGLMCI